MRFGDASASRYGNLAPGGVVVTPSDGSSGRTWGAYVESRYLALMLSNAIGLAVFLAVARTRDIN